MWTVSVQFKEPSNVVLLGNKLGTRDGALAFVEAQQYVEQIRSQYPDCTIDYYSINPITPPLSHR